MMYMALGQEFSAESLGAFNKLPIVSKFIASDYWYNWGWADMGITHGYLEWSSMTPTPKSITSDYRLTEKFMKEVMCD